MHSSPPGGWSRNHRTITRTYSFRRPASVHSGNSFGDGEVAVRKVLFIFSVLSDADVEWLAKVGEHTPVDARTGPIPPRARAGYPYFVLDRRLALRPPAGEPLALGAPS